MILDRAALEVRGIEGWAFGFEDVVRYRDLDTYNHVNNVVHHSWFEDIRVMFFDYLDLKLQEENEALPVMRTADISFNKQMWAGARFVVLTKPTKIECASIPTNPAARGIVLDYFLVGLILSKSTIV